MPEISFDVQPAWSHALNTKLWWPRCAQRVLVVTDGLNYDPGDGFGLTVFLGELTKAFPTPTITTELRGPFVFDATVTITNYDQIWLFGVSGPSLTPQETTVLETFMDAGGGVFATGDHEQLGLALCGSIPRVRGMREWSATPMVNERIDTVTSPGDDALVTFNDQSDVYPQRIFPAFYGSGASFAPHPVLQAARVIDVLPDHPHESVCYGSTSTLQQGDFPLLGTTPYLPQVIAWSVSAGRFVTDTAKPPTTPKLFGAISAYDGRPFGQGRIVCDATWHHFVNINLDGTGSGRIGLQTAPGTFTADFEQIARYYRNILSWLTPPGRVWCWWWILLVVELYRYPLREEFFRLRHPCPWEPRVRLGRIVETAIESRHGRGAAWEMVTEALERADDTTFADVVRGQPTDRIADTGDDREPTLLDADVFRRGLLGSIADALVADLPDNPNDVPPDREDHDDDAIRDRVVEAVRDATKAAGEYYGAAARRTIELFN